MGPWNLCRSYSPLLPSPEISIDSKHVSEWVLSAFQQNFIYGHWNLNFVSFSHVMKYCSSFDFVSITYKCKKATLSSWAIVNKEEGWAWPADHSLSALRRTQQLEMNTQQTFSIKWGRQEVGGRREHFLKNQKPPISLKCVLCLGLGITGRGPNWFIFTGP